MQRKVPDEITPTPVTPETTPQGVTPVTPGTAPNKAGRVTKAVEKQTQITANDNTSSDEMRINYYPGMENLESDATGLDWRNVAGEMYTAITEQPEPVYMQKYRPELMQDYRVSFQDRINRNNAALRAANQAIGNNPSAQAALAAQNYTANQDVAAEEFRFNQGTAANVYNQNRAIMNETQKINLDLAAQQAHKQSVARSNTRRNRMEALGSFATKSLMHDAAMNKLRVYENMYDYRFDPEYRAKYAGSPAAFAWSKVNGYSPTAQTTKGKTVGSTSESTKKRTKTYTLPNGQKVVEELKTKERFGGSLAKAFKSYKP